MEIYREKEFQTEEQLRWAVVSENNTDLDSLDNISNATVDFLANQKDESMPLAYDVRADVRRYEELQKVYGGIKAEEYLREEMKSDMASHLSELGSEHSRVRLYEYGFLLSEDGELREGEGEKDLVANMFTGQENEVVGSLWMNHLIPFLEDAEVGQSAFTLCVKADSIFEGAYDFAYFIMKTSEDGVRCFGVELNLSREEQREIINNQLTDQKAPEKVLLRSNFHWREARGRAVFYEKGGHTSFEEMFLSIVGMKLASLRGEYELASREEIKDFIGQERVKVEGLMDEVESAVEKMTSKIVSGKSHLSIEDDLKITQINHLLKYDPEIFWEAKDVGYIVLACGLVNFGGENSITSLFNNEKSWNYHVGDCVNCKMCNIEVGPCNICKSCEKEFDATEL